MPGTRPCVGWHANGLLVVRLRTDVSWADVTSG